MRATARIADVSITTVMKLFVQTGKACMKFLDEKIRNVAARRVQCDEIWSFVYAKQRNSADIEKESGDKWIWLAIDAESKLIISWHIGPRDTVSSKTLMSDLSSRLKHPIQLSTDGYLAYPDAVRVFFDYVDYGQVEKVYGCPVKEDGTRGKRIQYLRSEKKVVSGNPDLKHISTSYIERQNLTMRMCIRRLTRKTNAFSKKPENHRCAIALYIVYYNFVRIHMTLRVTPAMTAGITKRFMSFADVVKLAGNSN